MSKTRIIVIKRKQVILTGIIALAAIAFVIVLVCSMGNNGDSDGVAVQEQQSLYIPGVYTSVVTLGDSRLMLELMLDRNNVAGLNISNVDDTVTTMYPLVAPSLERIEQQLLNGIHIDEIELTEESRYTQTILIESIRELIEQSENSNNGV